MHLVIQEYYVSLVLDAERLQPLETPENDPREVYLSLPGEPDYGALGITQCVHHIYFKVVYYGPFELVTPGRRK